MVRIRTALLLATLLVAACGAPQSPPSPPQDATSGADASAVVEASAADDTPSCPVTSPGTAPREIGDRLFGWESAFGNEALWVGGLGPGGIIEAQPADLDADGSIGWKFGWFLLQPGHLRITATRLDAAAPTATPFDSGRSGASGFHASGVHFPTEGCWEVTGSIGGPSLTFVTLVVAPT